MPYQKLKTILTLFFVLTLWSCTPKPTRDADIGDPVQWSRLPQWQEDRHAEAWPALFNSCLKLKNKPPWTEICAAAAELDSTDDATVREFFETHFQAHHLSGKRRGKPGLITGYYEPLLFGSRQPTAKYRFPVYRKPDDLLTINLASLYPDLKNKRLRGRLQDQQIIPYYSRTQIESGNNPLAGLEIVWVDDAVMLFFLHVQGSGRVQLPDDATIGVGYADQNGHPYVSIGKRLIEWGELQREDVTLFSIRNWLRHNADKAEKLYAENPSYIFFRETRVDQSGPVGALQVPLVAERSIAVDKKVIPLGFPVWLDTSEPGVEKKPYQRLVFAQDTGGAIAGLHRADIFWGTGEYAEQMAGTMKQKGRLYLLLPNPALYGPWPE